MTTVLVPAGPWSATRGDDQQPVGGGFTESGLPPAAIPSVTEGTLRAFSNPDRGWALVLDALGIAMDSVQPIDDPGTQTTNTGQQVIGRSWLGSELSSGFMLGVILKKAEKPGDALTCRDTLWTRFRNEDMTRIRKSGDAEQAYIEYMAPSARSRNLHIFRVHDGYWLAIHLSKVDYRGSDDGSFEKLRTSVRIRTDTARGAATRP